MLSGHVRKVNMQTDLKTHRLPAMKKEKPRSRQEIRAIAQSLGPKYRELRLRAQLNQATAARKSGLSRTTLSRFENGKAPNLGIIHLELLARTLGLSLNAFLALADQHQPTNG